MVGTFQTLKFVAFDASGAYLDGGDLGEIYMPLAEYPQEGWQDWRIDQSIEVFIFLDSTDLLTATTRRPLIQLGRAAILKVVALERIGAFLNWGLSKDLMLPFAEQSRDLRLGDEVVVFLYIDKSGRLSASMRVQRHIDHAPGKFEVGQAVELMIFAKTDLGFKAIVDGRHLGMLYADEVYQPLRYAEKLTGYIQQVRPDHKLDLTLTRTGRKAVSDEIAPKILERLTAKNGFLAINDKTPADEIHRLFGVSRKKFKIALGGLYKQRQIRVEKDGIHLVPGSNCGSAAAAAPAVARI